MAVFQEFLQRLQWQPHAVSDLVPWRMLAAPGVVLLKDQHALMRTYAVRGRDVMGEEPETIGARMLQANNVIKRLGGRWMLQSEAQRSRLAAYPQARWTQPIAAAIDADREQALLVEPVPGRHAIIRHLPGSRRPHSCGSAVASSSTPPPWRIRRQTGRP